MEPKSCSRSNGSSGQTRFSPLGVFFGKTRLIDNIRLAMKQYDFVVIGSGIAGLSFALKAAQARSVAVITKRKGADRNTAWAQGGVACVTSDEDSFELHVRDTLEAGAGLCDEAVVRTIVTEGPERIRELMSSACTSTSAKSPAIASSISAGKAAIPSAAFCTCRMSPATRSNRRCCANWRAHPNVELLENHMAVDLITAGKLGFRDAKTVASAFTCSMKQTGEVETIRSDRLVLATGGCGKVYLYTTNPDVATGDGVAMAWRAGAVIANMEFIQFHPTCLFHPKAKSFLISEAVRGEGGILRNSRGEDFMAQYHPQRLAGAARYRGARDRREMKRTGAQCVFLDITHKPRGIFQERFPNIYETCLRFGIDITKQPIPVVPAAHYQCGGVKTDVNGATRLPGLYAVGEVACTGLHGANRLASNSLLEGLVWRIAPREALVRDIPTRMPAHSDSAPEWQSGDVQDVDELVVIYHNWDEIRRLMWDYVGIVRTDKRLQRARARLRNLAARDPRVLLEFQGHGRPAGTAQSRHGRGAHCRFALSRRKESRGLHYTLDYPGAIRNRTNRCT